MGEEVEIALDGSEGGGQLLRAALSLSLITGRPFRLRGLRVNRTPPGLRPQHLACLRGAEAISGGHSEGAQVGSDEVAFRPAPVKPGPYLLEMGTAGSASLLFQCLFYPLALAGGGELTVRGGTHLPQSPAYPYLGWIWLPTVEAYGFRASLQLIHAGFYPEGAGELRGVISPSVEPPERLSLPSRGTLQEVVVTSWVGGLPPEVAERQSRLAISALRERGIYAQAETLRLPTTRSSGGVVFVRAQFENTAAGFTGLLERTGKPEAAAQAAVDAFGHFMASPGALDEHLGDQILFPAALLAAGRLGGQGDAVSRFTVERVTGHLKTHARVLEAFLPVKVSASGEGMIEVAPASAASQAPPPRP